MVKWAHFPPVQNKRTASDQCFCEEDNNVLLSCNALEVIISATNYVFTTVVSCFKVNSCIPDI